MVQLINIFLHAHFFIVSYFSLIPYHRFRRFWVRSRDVTVVVDHIVDLEFGNSLGKVIQVLLFLLKNTGKYLD